MRFGNHHSPPFERAVRVGEEYTGTVRQWCYTAETWVDSGWQSGAHSVTQSLLSPPSLPQWGDTVTSLCGGKAILLKQDCTVQGKPKLSYSNYAAADNSPPLSSIHSHRFHYCFHCQISKHPPPYKKKKKGGGEGFLLDAGAQMWQTDVTSHHPLLAAMTQLWNLIKLITSSYKHSHIHRKYDPYGIQAWLALFFTHNTLHGTHCICPVLH